MNLMYSDFDEVVTFPGGDAVGLCKDGKWRTLAVRHVRDGSTYFLPLGQGVEAPNGLAARLMLKLEHLIAERVRHENQVRDLAQQVAATKEQLSKAMKLETASFVYDPKFGDDRVCQCGHPYYRHFDSHEDMAPVGCKYCQCERFVEKTDGEGKTGG